MPQTESPKKRRIRFCGDCGYELARNHDGPCPMCRRFEQLRLDLTVPRPSDLAAHRPGAPDITVSGLPDEWPPTVAEYRAILAERRLRSDSGGNAATVIRTAAMRQPQPTPPRGNVAPGEVALNSAEAEPEAEDLASSPSKEPKARRGKGKDRRAARARARSSPSVESTEPYATASLGPLPSPASPAAPSSLEPPNADGPEGGTTRAAGTDMPPRPRHPAQPLPHGGPVPRRAFGPRLSLPSGVTVAVLVFSVAVLVLSGLTGAAVAILLSSP